MNGWNHALWIARKDLKVSFRDRTGLLLGFLLPLVLVSVFGFIMKFMVPSGSGMPQVTLWVSDEDQTERSRRFVEQLRVSDMVRLRPREDQSPRDAKQLRENVADGEAHHALIIRPGFEASLSQGEPPELLMLRDPGREMEDNITRIALMQAFMVVSEGQLWPHAMGKMMRDLGMSEAQVSTITGFSKSIQSAIAAFADQNQAEETSAGDADPETNDSEAPSGSEASFDFGNLMVDMVPLQNEDIQPPSRPELLTHFRAQSVSGVMVMMLMFGLVSCGSMLIQERERGTLPRLLTTGVPRNSVLWGKFIFCVVMGMLQILIVSGFGELVFGVAMFRDIPTLLAISFTWVVTSTSFGVLIASWAKTQKQAEGLATLLILMMSALGGCWFPVQQFDLPLFAEVVTRSTLTYWAMSAYQTMLWHQKSLFHPTILTSLGVLWGFTLLASYVASHFYRRRYVGA